jgi:hypothetical protein
MAQIDIVIEAEISPWKSSIVEGAFRHFLKSASNTLAESISGPTKPWR